MSIKLETLVLPLVAEDNITGTIKGVSKALLGIVAAAGAAAGALATKSFLEAARVEELIVVNNVLAKNAGYAASALQQEAAEVRKMGIEFGASQNIVAEFVKNHLDLAKASDLARVAQDAAVISGANSTETTEQLIHGIVTMNPLVLRNAGLITSADEAYAKYAETHNVAITAMTAFQRQQAFLDLVLERGTDIAGAYTAAMTQPGKVLRSMPRYINDIFVLIGRKLTPSFGNVVFAIAEFTKGLGNALEKGGPLEPLITRIGDALLPMSERAKEFVENIDWSKVADFLAPAVEAFEKVMRVIDDIMGLDFSSTSFKIHLQDLFEFTGFGKEFSNVIMALFDSGFASVEFNEAFSDLTEKIDTAVGMALDNVDWTGHGEAFGAFVENFFTEGIDASGARIPSTIEQFIKGSGEFFAAAIGTTGGWSEAGQYMADTFVKGMYILEFKGAEATRALFEKINAATYEAVLLWASDLYTQLIENVLGTFNNFTVSVGDFLRDTFPMIFGEGGSRASSQLAAGVQSGLPSVLGSITTLGLSLDQKLRDVAKVFFNRAQGWAQQAMEGFLQSKAGILSVIQTLVDEINGILRKIITSFTLTFGLGGENGNTAGTSATTSFGGYAGNQQLKDDEDGRASGGPVIKGRSYNVAEFFRPEVFTAPASGRIDPMVFGRREQQPLDEERLARIIVHAFIQAQGGR